MLSLPKHLACIVGMTIQPMQTRCFGKLSMTQLEIQLIRCYFGSVARTALTSATCTALALLPKLLRT